MNCFAVPDDFSALDDMDTLQSFCFNESRNHAYPPEVLTDFEKHHPGCKRSGNLKTVKDDGES